MKLVVGLGNPGKSYEMTRHNMGFWFIDEYLSNKNINLNWKNKFNCLFCETIIGNDKVIFMKPQTFMNLSGTAVKSIVNFYKIDISDILVISDDMDLITGNFKLKSGGSSGGHNGLKNISECLGTNDYKRLKIGISKSENIDTIDYVLGKISNDDKKLYLDLFKKLSLLLDDYFVLSFTDLMNKYNRKNR